jgi:heat shock protein HtpX
MRREKFPPDRQLQMRTMAVLALSVVMLVALVGALVAITVTSPSAGVAIVIFLAAFAFFGWRMNRRHAPQRLAATDPAAIRCRRALEPLSMLAGLPEPEVAVVADHVPLSWTLAPRSRRSTIYVTSGLVDEASDDELVAVLAHELSHIINRDAILMTAIAGVPTAMLRAARAVRRRGFWVAYTSGAMYTLPALLPLWTSRIFSRYRELAADRGAAVLTGDPSSVAAALLHFSGDLKAIPVTDLRVAGISDLFHFLPARRDEPEGMRRMWATHPPLAVRLAQLDRLERELQHPGAD